MTREEFEAPYMDKNGPYGKHGYLLLEVIDAQWRAIGKVRGKDGDYVDPETQLAWEEAQKQ
jgi:hypothetical protein